MSSTVAEVPDEKGTMHSDPSSPSFQQDAHAIAQRPTFSQLRKYSLLVFFCLSQFLDVFNLSAMFSAVAAIAIDLKMTGSEPVWTISALQLTFASFLLISGRISDIYSAKWAFIVGIAGLGLIDLGTGWVRNKIGFFVLRAFGGIFSALNIPSALQLIVNMFPDPKEQATAIAVFGGTGAIALTLGVLVGAAFVQDSSWHWIFWFVAIVALVVAILSVPLIPEKKELQRVAGPRKSEWQKLKELDLVGLVILTAALVLLVYSLTQGSNSKWKTAHVIAPLIVSVFMIAGFLVWETMLPAEYAIVPPSTWFIPNFSVLFGTAFLPYLWWATIFFVYIQYWQGIFQWSAMSSAVHVLPAGIVALFVTPTGPLQERISAKWIILFGYVLSFIGTILLPFSGKENQYWSRVFPGFLLGSCGMMIIFIHSNIAIFRTTPNHMAGVVGALYNSALQIGSAVGTAIVTSISTSIAKKDGPVGILKFDGRADGFWFLFATVVVGMLSMLIFYRTDAEGQYAAKMNANAADADERDLKH